MQGLNLTSITDDGGISSVFDFKGDGVIEERADNDGHGQRTITDHNGDGETKTESEEFETEVDENGDYGTSPEQHPRGPANSGSSGSGSSSGAHTRPGRGGDPSDPNGSMAEWCANNEPYVSGVKQAAATDPSAFSVDLGTIEICDPLVRNPGFLMP